MGQTHTLTTNVNLLDKHIFTIKKNTGALLLEVGLVANFEKAKHIYMSGKQNTGRKDKILVDNILLKCDKFRILRKDTAKLKLDVEEIKKSLNSKNDCYHSAQNSLSFPLLFKH